MSVESKVQSLITAANSVTGESRTDLTACVQDLKDGYGGGGLPAEYEAVDYIESTGTQYIDTGYVAQPFTDVDCEIYVDSNTPIWYCAFGAYSSSKSFQLMLKTTNSQPDRWRYFCESYLTDARECYNKKIRFTTFNLGAQWYDLGTDTWAISRGGSHETIYSLGIFAGHESSGFFTGTLMRCYSFKIYEIGELVRDFIPCVRKADSEAGLYDLVNGVFYTNQGTGDFVVPSA